MLRIRLRPTVATLAIVLPALVLGGIAASPLMTSASACNVSGTDNDVEYGGDVDTWCPNPQTSPGPTTSPTATATPTPASSPTSTPPSISSPTPTPLLASSAFPVAYFAPSFKGPATRQFQQQFIVQNGSYVTVGYPAGSSSPSSGVPGGAQAQLKLAAGAVDDATLTYQIRFPVGFQWVKGGKLPGLCGGQCWTGSNNGPGGFAMRLMWRAGGVGEVLLSDAVTTGYGTDLGRGTSFTFSADSNWHSVAEHVHLNTASNADGYIDIAYDGTLYHFAGLEIRSDTTRIDSLMFSTFFGGHDSTWAPSADMHIDFQSFGA